MARSTMEDLYFLYNKWLIAIYYICYFQKYAWVQSYWELIHVEISVLNLEM